MFMRGVGHFGQTAELQKVFQCAQVALLDVATRGLVKLQRPVVGLTATCAALHLPQVMHDVAAVHNQHTPLAQGFELLGQGVMLFRGAAVVYAELDFQSKRSA